jgi:hypothetical protein
MVLEKRLNFIRENMTMQYSNIARCLSISVREAMDLKRTVKQFNYFDRLPKNGHGVIFGSKQQAYQTEQEALTGYQPPTYEELLKEF